MREDKEEAEVETTAFDGVSYGLQYNHRLRCLELTRTTGERRCIAPVYSSLNFLSFDFDSYWFSLPDRETSRIAEQEVRETLELIVAWLTSNSNNSVRAVHAKHSGILRGRAYRTIKGGWQIDVGYQEKENDVWVGIPKEEYEDKKKEKRDE